MNYYVRGFSTVHQCHFMVHTLRRNPVFAKTKTLGLFLHLFVGVNVVQIRFKLPGCRDFGQRKCKERVARPNHPTQRHHLGARSCPPSGKENKESLTPRPRQMSTWTGKDKDNDNDIDQTFCQVSVQKALTCPEGQSARALAPSLIGERKLAPCRKNLPGTPAQTSCHVGYCGPVSVLEAETLFAQNECVAETRVAVFASFFAVVALLLGRINSRFVWGGRADTKGEDALLSCQ